MDHRKKDPHQRLESLERWSGHATLLILLGIVVEIGLLFWFPHEPTERLGSIIANLLIGIGLAIEYVVILRAVVAGGEAKRDSDEKVANAEARSAEANQKAAAANEKTAELQIALEKERQKRLARALTKDQFDILQTLRGKVSKVYVTCDRDPEALYFSGQITTALKHAGIELVMRPSRTGDVGTGVLIMLGSAWPGKATEHPLVDAFLKAGLLRGGGIFEGGAPTLPPDGPLLLIGQKMVELENPHFPSPKDTERHSTE